MNNPPVPVWRWLVTLVVGVVVWMVGRVLAATIASSLFGEELKGGALAVFAGLAILLVTTGLHFTQRIPRRTLRDLGLTFDNWRTDALIGAGVGLVYAVVQFGLIIPNTGGALREDVIASRELMGGTVTGLISGIILGWLVGGFCEELFFRGFLITNIRYLFGHQRWGLWIGVVISVVYFAYGHAYQGWIGMVDVGIGALLWTGLYLWRGRLTAAMVGHGLWDMLAFLGLYFLYGGAS